MCPPMLGLFDQELGFSRIIQNRGGLVIQKINTSFLDYRPFPSSDMEITRAEQ